MRIESNNNINFNGLTISPKLKPEIAKRGEEFIAKLKRIGEETSEVKMYDVVFDDSLYPKIKHRNKVIDTDYFAILKKEESNLGKYYEIPSAVRGKFISRFYPDEPLLFRNVYRNMAKEKYKAFKQLDVYEQAAEYSKMLEQLDFDKLTVQDIEDEKCLASLLKDKTKSEEMDNIIDDLINRYRLEPQEIPEKPVKKSFWQRLFG